MTSSAIATSSLAGLRHFSKWTDPSPARFGFHVHAIAQQAIHRVVVFTQAAVEIAGFGGRPVEGPTDVRCFVVCFVKRVSVLTR